MFMLPVVKHQGDEHDLNTTKRTLEDPPRAVLWKATTGQIRSYVASGIEELRHQPKHSLPACPSISHCERVVVLV